MFVLCPSPLVRRGVPWGRSTEHHVGTSVSGEGWAGTFALLYRLVFVFGTSISFFFFFPHLRVTDHHKSLLPHLPHLIRLLVLVKIGILFPLVRILHQRSTYTYDFCSLLIWLHLTHSRTYYFVYLSFHLRFFFLHFVIQLLIFSWLCNCCFILVCLLKFCLCLHLGHQTVQVIPVFILLHNIT